MYLAKACSACIPHRIRYTQIATQIAWVRKGRGLSNTGCTKCHARAMLTMTMQGPEMMGCWDAVATRRGSACQVLAHL